MGTIVRSSVSSFRKQKKGKGRGVANIAGEHIIIITVIYIYYIHIIIPMPNEGPVMEENVLTWRMPLTEGKRPSARGGHTAVLVHHDLIVFGGHSYMGSGKFMYFEDTCVLDLESNTWHKVRTGGDSPSGRYGHSANVVDGKIYVIGGKAESGQSCKDVYFLDTDSWCWVRVSSATSGPCGRFGHATTVVGSKIVVSGGWDGAQCFDDTWIFNTLSCTWMKPATTGRGPSPRHGHSLELIPNGSILVFGGFGMNATTGAPEYLKDVVSLNTETMEWSRPRVRGEYPLGRYAHTSCVVGKYLLCTGGWFAGMSSESKQRGSKKNVDTSLGGHQKIIALDTETMVWCAPRSKGRVPEHRYGHAVVSADTQIIIFGGWGGNRALNDIHVAEMFGPIVEWFEDEQEERESNTRASDEGEDDEDEEDGVETVSEDGLGL